MLLCVALYVCNAPVRKNSYADYHEVKLKINQSIVPVIILINLLVGCLRRAWWFVGVSLEVWSSASM